MWPQVRAKLAGEPHGQALLDAMEDERRLIGPLQAVTDDAFTMDTDPGRLQQLLTRLLTRLTSHLAHEEAEALPLIGQIMTQDELGGIARAIGGGHNLRHAAATVPWALAGVSPDVRTRGTASAASTHPPCLPANLAAAPHPQHAAAVMNGRSGRMHQPVP